MNNCIETIINTECEYSINNITSKVGNSLAAIRIDPDDYDDGDDGFSMPAPDEPITEPGQGYDD